MLNLYQYEFLKVRKSTEMNVGKEEVLLRVLFGLGIKKAALKKAALNELLCCYCWTKTSS
jgi:hypothetical protein